MRGVERSAEDRARDPFGSIAWRRRLGNHRGRIARDGGVGIRAAVGCHARDTGKLEVLSGRQLARPAESDQHAARTHPRLEPLHAVIAELAAHAAAAAVGNDQDIEAWQVAHAPDCPEGHGCERRVQLLGQEVPEPAVARFGDAITGGDQDLGGVKATDLVRPYADVGGVREGRLHGDHRDAECRPERRDALVQRRGIPLGARDEGAPRIRPPVGPHRRSGRGQFEAFPFQRDHETCGSGPVVQKEIGARCACGRRWSWERRVRYGLATGTGILGPIGVEIEGQRQRPRGDVIEPVVLFIRVLPPAPVTMELGLLPRDKRSRHFRVGLQHGLRDPPLGLIQIDDVAAGRECSSGRGAAETQVAVRRTRG